MKYLASLGGDKRAGVNKNYMSIGVSVRTTKFAARNNGFGVRQESNPQSPTAYSSVRYKATQKDDNGTIYGHSYTDKKDL
jgi:hypothetical protein